ncbi:sulfatase-like hydrolase/transferase [Rhodopirellula europaea]|uniref:Sulfatase N-terminal domain-containing protein n=1 Tax=Rhodopirellula europaea 6C TaxID=1263867 RepID=M2A7R2_9BACT|nr:sulfatase-like hydrolase/transferase [Rhodopirellula europaea]EMB17496.1 hypothetical protein RE6C_01762 [Rhodopirellula europaea 6C]
MHNATYLATIKHRDKSTGRLIGKLDELSPAENTMVVFLNDNGDVMHKYDLSTDSPETTEGNAPLRKR